MNCDLPTLLWVHACPNIPLTLKRSISDSGVINYWPLSMLNELKTWTKNRSLSRYYSEVAKTAALIESGAVSLLRYGHSDYPTLLMSTPNPPPFLLALGDTSRLSAPLISVVGSRQYTAHAHAICSRWVPQLVKSGVGIVSGMALGVDGIAHTMALNSGGYTVAVLAGGIDQCYPRQHRKLYEQIKKNGCILSEMPLGYRAKRYDFPRRNRIISGLSQVTLVVEAKVKSGSLISAKEAVLASRRVFAVPGSPLASSSQGCLSLINDGAEVAISPSQLLKALRIEYTDELPKSSGNHYVEAVASGAMTTAELASYFGESQVKILIHLVELELEGRLVHDGGIWFQSYQKESPL